ncbi:MAG: topoisomerase DNA-binding C4 zinc finger domain-containing protein, partial [Anaerolineaceae bacterium]|nr:topoisomerase DNA-binding C4 zinc finger domain-containing protein [Anaerolineaceae bacterium]
WTTPRCTKCGAEMVMRSAKSGPNQGKRFWGCSNYPKCRNILPIEENCVQ